MLGLHFGGSSWTYSLPYTTADGVGGGTDQTNIPLVKTTPFSTGHECDVFLVIIFLVITFHTHELFYDIHGTCTSRQI